MKPTHEQKLQALKDSVARWQLNVELFGGLKSSDSKASRNQECPLCKLYGGPSEACEQCPLEDCVRGKGKGKTLYEAVSGALTNAEAYIASKTMLARLQELLKEEEGRKPEHDIRVGDVVVNHNCAKSKREMAKYSGVVYAVYDAHINYRSRTGYDGACAPEFFTLIHRPTK